MSHPDPIHDPMLLRVCEALSRLGLQHPQVAADGHIYIVDTTSGITVEFGSGAGGQLVACAIAGKFPAGHVDALLERVRLTLRETQSNVAYRPELRSLTVQQWIDFPCDDARFLNQLGALIHDTSDWRGWLASISDIAPEHSGF